MTYYARLPWRSLPFIWLFLTLACLPARAEDYLWPDAPPAQLKEELFGIRFRLKLADKGPAGAHKFLQQELARDPQPHTKAYVAWVSLFAKAWGIEPIVDPHAARQLAEEARAAGSAVASDVLARSLLYGEHFDHDEAAGMQLLQEAAARGLPRAIGKLGYYWMTGWTGQKANQAEGARLVKQAAALGANGGLSDTAEGFERGRIPSPVGRFMAQDYYYRLALCHDPLGRQKLAEFAEKGVPGAALLLELFWVQFANEGGWIMPGRAREHVERLEAMNSPEPRAWVELGLAHLMGVYAKRDYPKAHDYLQRAAASGSADARFFLAYAELRGLGMPKDSKTALAEMEAQAAAGNIRAAALLGGLYYWNSSDAPGLGKDEDKAFRYIRQSAAGGWWFALMNLGFCYDHGIGVAPNPVLAAKVYYLAMEYGATGAKERLIRNLAFAKVP